MTTIPTRHKDTAERFNVRDGQRNVTFMGWKLAEADSQSGNDVRWTELELYRTLTGNFVLVKVGRSDVFHTQDCQRKSKGKRHENLDEAFPEDADENDTIEDVFVPCPDCQPDYDVTPAWVERDIFSVVVHDNASAAVDTLYRRDVQDGSKYLSRVARSLLEAAADVDPDIHRVMNAPADVT